MSRRHMLTRAYLSPTPQSFWRWSGDGDAVEWHTGKTIAFRQEIAQVLGRLAPRGLPPFAAVVLLLAACRDGWQASDDGFGTRTEFMRWLGWHRATPSSEWTKTLVAGLNRVHELPTDLRAPIVAKSVLAELVFDDTRHRWSPSDAVEIVQAVVDGVSPSALLEDPMKGNGLAGFRIAHDVLVHGLKRVDAEVLRRLGRTGVDRLVKPATIDLPPMECVRQLIRQLKADKELIGLGRLASDLMAAVHIPRAISTPDELPVGGVSDISNRGPLDRLLVSELAHDDLTLAVRVALNEALYLRREEPPQTPPRGRMILIDSGIRLWGVPRLFATAVALAVAATANRQSAISAFRAARDGLVPVDLGSREGLERHLEALEPAPHPAAAFSKFFKQADAPDGTDRVIITSDDVFADPEFRAEMTRVANDRTYVATVSRTGSFRLMSLSQSGAKMLRSAQLSLTELLEPPKSKTGDLPLVTADPDSSLPLILSLDPFPLLLSHEVDFRNVRVSERHGAITVTKDGRLMQWQALGSGGKQLTSCLPAGQLRSLAIEDDLCRLTIENSGKNELSYMAVDLENAHRTILSFPVQRAQTVTVFCHGDLLFRVLRQKTQVFSITGGHRLDEIAHPHHTEWKSGRFFLGPAGWMALGADDLTARFDAVRLRPEESQNTLLLFDRPGHDGPWGLRHDGVFSTATGKFIELKDNRLGPIAPIGVSDDGNLVAIRSTQKEGLQAIVDLTTETTTICYGDAAFRLRDRSALNLIRARNIMRRFHGVTIDGRGRLALVRPGRWLSVTLDSERQKLELLPDQGVPVSGSSNWIYIGANADATVVERPEPVRAFRRVPSPTGCRYRLSMAKWPDGSRAYLDSRGLLHLVSREPAIPQITLVLDQTELAACCLKTMEKPVFAGLPYSIGNRPRVTAQSVYFLIQRFVETAR
jgi:hypothetical protein